MGKKIIFWHDQTKIKVEEKMKNKEISFDLWDERWRVRVLITEKEKFERGEIMGVISEEKYFWC